jgi:hypothetical protein
VFFKLILAGGHVGAGKSYDMVRYFRANDIISVMDSALKTPRVKKKRGGQGVKLIQPISEREYQMGKTRETDDPYLSYHRL